MATARETGCVTSIDFVVLLGAPGTGKSYYGALLARELRLCFFEAEVWLMGQFGTGEIFAAQKALALERMYEHVRELRARGEPVVFENTGLSDAAYLRGLQAASNLAIVRVEAPAELCAQRVQNRVSGRNFSNDATKVVAFHAYWDRNVSPAWPTELRVESGRQSDEAVVAFLSEALGVPRRSM